jgi:hypothetical protein
LAAKPTETAVIVPGETGRSLINPFGIDIPDDLLGQMAELSDGSEELMPTWPQIKLIQGTTRGVQDSTKHMGEWYHTDREQFDPLLEVIPLRMTDQRTLFGTNDVTPLCSAPDGKYPLPNQKLWTMPTVEVRGGKTLGVPKTQPMSCAECPFSQFGLNNAAPVCNESILLMVMRDDDQSFAQVRIGGTGLKPFRSTVRRRLVYRNRRVPLFTHLFTFGSEAIESGNKKWMQLTVNVAPLSADQVREMVGLATAMQESMQSEIERSTETLDMRDVTPSSEGTAAAGGWDDDPNAPPPDFEDLPFE